MSNTTANYRSWTILDLSPTYRDMTFWALDQLLDYYTDIKNSNLKLDKSHHDLGINHVLESHGLLLKAYDDYGKTHWSITAKGIKHIENLISCSKLLIKET